MKLLIYFLLSLSLLGCDSPLRHKSDEKKQVKAQASLLLELGQYKFTYKWTQGPFPTSASSLKVFIYDQNENITSLTPNDQLHFDASMPSMGHGLGDPGFFIEIAPGVYENKNILLTMGGPWEMEIYIVTDSEISGSYIWAEDI